MGRAPPKEGAVDIQQLRFIVATAQRGSFTDAADALYVSRAALSKSVSRLESELGFPLFDRTCDGVRLTDAGKRFVEKAMPVVEGFKELQGTIHQEHRVTTVTVGIPLTWTDYFSIPLRRFAACHPNIDVRLHSWIDTELVNRLRDGDIDVAASHLPIQDTLDEGQRLGRYPLYIAMSKDCPLARLDSVTPEDILPYSVMYYTCGYKAVEWVQPLQAASILCCNDILHIYACVARGEVLFPTPIVTAVDNMTDIVYRRYVGQSDTVAVTGYISKHVRGMPNLESACRAIREALSEAR